MSLKEEKQFRRIAAEPINPELSYLEFGHSFMPAGMPFRNIRNTYILHFVSDGKGLFNGAEFDKSCAYLKTPNEMELHEARDSSYETYHVHFQGSLAPTILEQCGLMHQSHVFQFPHNEKCCALIKHALYEKEIRNDFATSCMLHAVFFEIISILSQHSEDKLPQPNIAQILAKYLEEHYRENIKIGELADKLHYSRNHLFVLFKQIYGISPQEYLFAVRIGKAKQLLGNRENPLSIKEVALSVGFRDPLYFTRRFHAETGETPSHYQKRTFLLFDELEHS